MTWSANEFVLYGTYCSTEDIRTLLQRVREKLRAAAALLTVRQDNTSFQSLLIVSNIEEAKERSIESELAKSIDMAGGAVAIATDVFVRAAMANMPRDGADAAYALARRIDLQIKRSIGASMHIALDRSGCQCVQRRPMELALTVSVFGYHVRTYEGIDGDLDELMCRVSASAPVRVYQDLATTRDVDLVASFQDARLAEEADASITAEGSRLLLRGSVAGQATLAREAASLLEAAMHITESSVGNIYLATADATQLRLIASKNNPQAISEMYTDDRKSVVGWVHWRQRPLLINDIEEFRRTHPTINYKWVGGAHDEAYAELAVPITYRSIGGASSLALGVINVEKVRNADEGQYTYKDLAALRQLAVRLSMWRINELFSVSADFLGNLTRRSIGNPLGLPAHAEAGALRDGADVTEFVAIREHLQHIVEEVHHLTQSSSVTIRLLSSDQRTLVRFCAFPPGTLADKFMAIPLRMKGSVNAWVVRSGRECYIRDLRIKSEIARYRGLQGILAAHARTRCELCLPIFVSGRVVGSMNLESDHAGGYHETVHLARAIAEQVGLALFQARQEHQRAIWTRATNLTVNTHEILKCVDKLRECAEMREPSQHDVLNIASRLHAAVDGLGQDMGVTENTVDGIVDGVISELNYTSHVRWVKRPAKHVLSESHAQAVKLAFTMILENAYREAMESRRFEVTLFADLVYFGGGRYLSVRVNNPLIKRLAPSLVRQLYRVPILRADRLHIGSYAAGTALRAIGGDIYVGHHCGNKMVTVAQIPL